MGYYTKPLPGGRTLEEIQEPIQGKPEMPGGVLAEPDKTMVPSPSNHPTKVVEDLPGSDR